MVVRFDKKDGVLNMSKTNKWYETFFDGLYAKVLQGQCNYKQTQVEAKLIKRILKLRKGQHVLDCPCGYGRITFELQKLGLNVTGVDLTAKYLQKARCTAKVQDMDIPFVRCDMRKLPFDNKFDAVINWFTSFGYFAQAGNIQAAQAAYSALKPDGKFIIETINKTWLLPVFISEKADEINGVHIKRKAKLNKNNDRIDDCWTMSKGNKTEKRSFSICIYNSTTLRALLQQAGFKNIQFFGRASTSDAPNRLTRHSRRLIAVATKS